MEIRHVPNVCHGCGRVNVDWIGPVRVAVERLPYGVASRSLSMLSPMRPAETLTLSGARWAHLAGHLHLRATEQLSDGRHPFAQRQILGGEVVPHVP
ncbi:MAG: hypothetical protein OXF07_12700 [Rhodobacter sp.]|nr:hypothetical protein [Rhodobacter sp.]